MDWLVLNWIQSVWRKRPNFSPKLSNEQMRTLEACLKEYFRKRAPTQMQEARRAVCRVACRLAHSRHAATKSDGWGGIEGRRAGKRTQSGRGKEPQLRSNKAEALSRHRRLLKKRLLVRQRTLRPQGAPKIPLRKDAPASQWPSSLVGHRSGARTTCRSSSRSRSPSHRDRIRRSCRSRSLTR